MLLLLSNRRGIAGWIIAAVIAAIIFTIWSWTKKSHAEKCLKTLTGPVATYNQSYRDSVKAGSPDAGICRQLNDLIADYNKVCAADYGTIPPEQCG